MSFAFNPLTGNFDLKGSGGGGGASYIDGEVATYTDLPLDGSAALNTAWLVREASGTWLIARKPAGIYIRTATAGVSRDADYTYAGILPDVFNDANFLLYDNADSSKNLAFQLSGISASTTRTLTIPNANGTIALTSDFAAPPAIGGTTAAAGTFTTLTASTSLTLGTSGILSGGTNLIEQVNSTSAQTFRLYNTQSGTGGVNFERLRFAWSSNVAIIGTEKGGTGSARALEFQTDGVTRMTFLTNGDVGIGITSPERPLHIQASNAMARIDRTGSNGPAFLMIRMATLGTVTSSWLFGPATGFASVANDDFSIIDFGTTTSGTGGTQRLTISKSTGQLTLNGNLNLSTKDLVTDTTTGTKIGTGTTQRIGFFNATPAVQPAAVADATDAASTQARLNDLLARLRTLGLIAT
jgi:hypothetical protein